MQLARSQPIAVQLGGRDVLNSATAPANVSLNSFARLRELLTPLLTANPSLTPLPASALTADAPAAAEQKREPASAQVSNSSSSASAWRVVDRARATAQATATASSSLQLASSEFAANVERLLCELSAVVEKRA